MGITTLAGMLLGFAAIVVTVILEGGSPSSLINLPGAVIILGGTFGATIASFPLGIILLMPKLFIKAIQGPKGEPLDTVKLFVELADKARKQGLLSLEEEEGRITDTFMKKGMALVVDGVDPEDVRKMLEMDNEQMAERHDNGTSLFASMGAYAPTMGAQAQTPQAPPQQTLGVVAGEPVQPPPPPIPAANPQQTELDQLQGQLANAGK